MTCQLYKKRNNKRNTKQMPKKATELRSHTSSSTAERNFGKYHQFKVCWTLWRSEI